MIIWLEPLAEIAGGHIQAAGRGDGDTGLNACALRGRAFSPRRGPIITGIGITSNSTGLVASGASSRFPDESPNEIQDGLSVVRRVDSEQPARES